jgi:hypothetical protein
VRTLRVKSAARALAVLSRFRRDDPGLTWKRVNEGDAYVVLEPSADGTTTAALCLEVRPNENDKPR